jgi:hypothetical protein
MKINKYICLYISSSFTVFINCGDSIDKTKLSYEAIGGYATSDDIAANNLITKVSFENAVTTSNGISGGVNSCNLCSGC